MKWFNSFLTCILVISYCAKNTTNDNDTKSQSINITKEVIKVESKKDDCLELDLSKTIKPFINKVLGENQRIIELDKINIRSLEIFSKNGLQKIVTYSDKRYPKNTKPSYYEHFILFAIQYEDCTKAKIAFENIRELSKLNYSNKLDDDKKQLLQRLEITLKPGGMICQKANYVFNLIKTCRETPIGGKWEKYENLFLNYIDNGSGEEMLVLNADCGRMKYIEERRKTQ